MGQTALSDPKPLKRRGAVNEVEETPIRFRKNELNLEKMCVSMKVYLDLENQVKHSNKK